MSDDFTSLSGTLEAFWSRLDGGVRDKGGPGRYLSLATRGLRSGAEARMVILRRADRGTGLLTVHTHALSHKVAELSADPRATLLMWDDSAGFQARIRVMAHTEPGSEADWARVPDASRRMNYGSLPPATPVDGPEALTRSNPDREAFTRILARIDTIETLHLGRDLVRRAIFARDGGFGGSWIAP